MREILVVALFVLSVLGVLIWRSGASPQQLFQARGPTSTAEAASRPHVEPTLKTKAQTKQAARKRTLSGSKPSVAVPASVTTWEVPVSAPEPRVVLPPPFPVAGDIKPGTTREHLYTSYGQPTLSATTVDSGDLAETFVYSRQPKQGPLTVIRLRDGRVVSSNDLN